MSSMRLELIRELSRQYNMQEAGRLTRGVTREVRDTLDEHEGAVYRSMSAIHDVTVEETFSDNSSMVRNLRPRLVREKDQNELLRADAEEKVENERLLRVMELTLKTLEPTPPDEQLAARFEVVARFVNQVGEYVENVSCKPELDQGWDHTVNVGFWDPGYYMGLVAVKNISTLLNALRMERLQKPPTSVVEPVRQDLLCECPICQDAETNHKTACGHDFCKECWDLWVNERLPSKATCPICRNPNP